MKFTIEVKSCRGCPFSETWMLFGKDTWSCRLASHADPDGLSREGMSPRRMPELCPLCDGRMLKKWRGRITRVEQ